MLFHACIDAATLVDADVHVAECTGDASNGLAHNVVRCHPASHAHKCTCLCATMQVLKLSTTHMHVSHYCILTACAG
jgi:hypothetical protein